MSTRKDYIRAASIVREYTRDYGPGIEKEIATRIASQVFVEFFCGDNPRFDEKRFLEACTQE